VTAARQPLLLDADAPRPVHAAAAEWVAIIDDHASMRSSLSRALRLDGFQVECFASAEAYLDRDPVPPPLCLVMDMHLPGMSGHDLAHCLARARPPSPPVIFISGHDDLLASLDGCCGHHGRLRKPFEIDALLALVRSLAAAR